MSGFFEEYKKEERVTDAIPEEHLQFDTSEPEKEWELDPYEQYVLDLYDFVGRYYHMSPSEFKEQSIDDILYLRDKLIDKLRIPPDDKEAEPIDYNHWGLLRTLAAVFPKKKR